MTTVDDDDPTHGNWLMSQIKNSKVTAIFSKTILCRTGIHQGGWYTGPWPTRSCQQRRFCIYCGRPQDRKKHNWSSWEYFKDNSCEMRIRCYDCGKTKPGGKRHKDVHKTLKGWGIIDCYCSRCHERWEEYDSGD